MNHQDKVRYLDGVAKSLAPCLRDKFDFSNDQQFKDWVDMSHKAAQFFLDKAEPLLAEALKKDLAEFHAAQALAQAAAAEAKPAPTSPAAVVEEVKKNGEAT